MTSPDLRILLVPGGGGSEPGHWHHRWAANDERCAWVEQADWFGGTSGDWIATLDRRVAESDQPTVLVAHSLATVVVAHWAAQSGPGPVVAALLVGPADVEADWAAPDSLYKRFAPIPLEPMPFRSMIVASTDDPYITVERAGVLAEAWNSRLDVVGAYGHLGTDADLGEWEQGRALLDELLTTA